MVKNMTKTFLIPNRRKIDSIYPFREVYNTYRYQHLPQISQLYGYIVNIHDASNYDIDICFPDHKTEYLYNSVIHNSYIYLDEEDKCIESTAYRCRLKGISTREKSSFDATQLIRELIDENNGWVTCSISDIDIYHRLLIDIDIGDVNVNELLIQNFPDIYHNYKK